MLCTGHAIHWWFLQAAELYMQDLRSVSVADALENHSNGIGDLLPANGDSLAFVFQSVAVLEDPTCWQ